MNGKTEKLMFTRGARTPGGRRCLKKGFTLLELLIVISVIALLAGLLFPAFGRVREGARKRQAEIEINIMRQAIAAYKMQYGRLPAPEPHLAAGEDVVYGVDDNDNAAVLELLLHPPLGNADDAHPALLDASNFRIEDDKVLNPWGQQYRFNLDLKDWKLTVSEGSKEN